MNLPKVVDAHKLIDCRGSQAENGERSVTIAVADIA
jgi:hypothetical protein